MARPYALPPPGLPRSTIRTTAGTPSSLRGTPSVGVTMATNACMAASALGGTPRCAILVAHESRGVHASAGRQRSRVERGLHPRSDGRVGLLLWSEHRRSKICDAMPNRRTLGALVFVHRCFDLSARYICLMWYGRGRGCSFRSQASHHGSNRPGGDSATRANQTATLISNVRIGSFAAARSGGVWDPLAPYG